MYMLNAIGHNCTTSSSVACPASDTLSVLPASRILQNGKRDVNMSQFAAIDCAAPDRLGWHQLAWYQRGDVRIDIKLGRVQTALRKRPLMQAPLFEVVIMT